MSKKQVYNLPRQLIEEIMFNCKTQIAKHTCQLFYVTPPTFEPSGSGVLVTNGVDYFLISAAHVLDYASNLSILNGKDLIAISGLNVITSTNGLPRRFDNKDIAIFKLESEAVELIKERYEFMPLERLGIDHAPASTQQYIIAGFPKSNTKGVIVNNVANIKARPIFLTTKVLSAAGCEKMECWRMEFDYNRESVIDSITKENIIGPHPLGVSGGGVWFVAVTPFEGKIYATYRLVGVATDYIGAETNVIVATKIDVVSEGLRQKFGLNIPKSKTITVNILNT